MAEDYTEALAVYLAEFRKRAMGHIRTFSIMEELLTDYYTMLHHQIHDFLVYQNSVSAERKIRIYLSNVSDVVLPWLLPKVGRSDVLKNLYKKFYALVAFRSLEHFAYYMDWNRTSDKKVWEDSMPAMRGIFYHGTKMILEDKVKLLKASCPVSTGKSYAFNTIMTYAIGCDPRWRVLSITESEVLSKGIKRNVRNMLLSSEFADVFPQFKRYQGNAEMMFEIDSVDTLLLRDSKETYTLICSTRKGANNGLRCDLLVLDDLTKGEIDADSPKTHAEVVGTYDTVWTTRADGENARRIVLGGTCWADYDLLNVVEKRVRDKQELLPDTKNKYTMISDDCRSVFISVPALDYETDESNFPKKFSTKFYREKRDELIPERWWAIFQQKPLPPKGLYFSWKNLRTYDAIPDGDIHYAFLDPARSAKNFVCLEIYKKVGEWHYLKDGLYRKELNKKMVGPICDKIINHGVTQLCVEVNTDASLPELIRKELFSRNYRVCTITEMYSWENKEDKISSLRGGVLENCVFPKKGMYSPNSEVGMIMEDITNYSFERKNDFDDGIDCCTMYVKKYCSGEELFGSVGTFNRRNK